MKDEEYPLQNKWEEYKFWRFCSITTVIFCLPITVLIIHLSNKIFKNFLITEYFIWGFLALWATLTVFCINKFATLRCPRCGTSYLHDLGKHSFSRRAVIYERCDRCHLPIYFGSTYFFDYWGTERGNKLIAEIEREKKNL